MTHIPFVHNKHTHRVLGFSRHPFQKLRGEIRETAREIFGNTAQYFQKKQDIQE